MLNIGPIIGLTLIKKLQDNHLTMHNDIHPTKEYKKSLKKQSAGILYLFKELWCECHRK